MKMKDNHCKQYIKILKEELVVALGCTEPISIAYGAAVARDILGEFPTRMCVHASGNIIKNVKSVIVPGSGGLKGVEAAAILGVVSGIAKQKLEVLNHVKKADLIQVNSLLKQQFCKVELIENVEGLDIWVHVWGKNDHVQVQLLHTHTNISKIIKNDTVIEDNHCVEGDFNTALTDRKCLNIQDIYNFSKNENIDEIRDLLEMQITYNMDIAKEGLARCYGAEVGKTLLETTNDIYNEAIAYTAAASDARMSGCSKAVMSNSGSGNQGLTCSVPVILYAQHKQLNHEELLRALLFSNLVTIRLKTGIGRLSAYCGVVCAACASVASFTYMDKGSMQQIEDTIINTLGSISGMVCDGAKPSCAAKIASALYSGVIAQKLAMNHHVFEPHTGIIKGDIEATIDAIGYLGRVGMKETDTCILHMMID
ncbi:MAG: L-serine ammonia-lyase, iron-sulfur-dependent, subunit alpha [Erysipelotrichaceae bacterium]